MKGLAVELRGVGKTYRKGGTEVRVLRDVSLRLDPGDRVAIVGPSGSGKSTLLHLLGLLDRPTEGEVALDHRPMGDLAEPERDRLRNRAIGFVFQSHNLLPEHDALDNVSVPVRLAGATPEVARARARALLDAVGLGHRLGHRPTELSGGEQQRVAIARALVHTPGLVLADEPTGNLDPETAADVFQLLLDLHDQLGTTLVVVTHDRELARAFPRRLALARGGVVEAA